MRSPLPLSMPYRPGRPVRLLLALALTSSSLAIGSFIAHAEAPAAPQGSAPVAPAMRLQDTWDLAPVYASVEAWDAEVAGVSTTIDGLASCRGTLSTNLRPCLERSFAVMQTLGRLNVYASNHANTDTRDAVWGARAQRSEMLGTQFGEVTAFFRPEIIALGSTAVEAAIQADPGLLPYDHYLRATVQDAPHTLDSAGEALLAGTGNVFGAAERTHSLLVNAELPWPTITLSDGTTGKLTPAMYTNVRAAPARADRKLVFDSFFGALHGFEGTLGVALDAAVQGDWMLAKAHHYDTSVAGAMGANHLPAAIYETLVKQTNQNLPTLHRYLRLRARMLGVKDLAYYDMYPSLVASDRTWTVDEAMALTIEATRPLGATYTTQLQSGFSGRWMDVFPQPGKRSGAYMDGAAYGVHPYLLLNYTGDYESVSTLAHEWGHAMHSVLASSSQPYAKSDYASFTAEIASTFNEALLLQQMLKTAKSDDERLFYLGNSLEGLRGTYFRQAQFAEFELAIHDKVEKGEPLTGASLSSMYLEILKRYYGADQGITQIDDAYGVEWAYIPHFFYDFYVYQYATSIAASSLLSEDVLAKKPGALDRYLGLLKAGGSDDPYVLLKRAGVDLATPAPYDAIPARMNKIMDEMEKIIAKKKK